MCGQPLELAETAEETMGSGTTNARCPRQPIIDLSSLAVVIPAASSWLMSVVQVMNLFLGSKILRSRKSNSQPRIVLISVRPASAISLSRASMLSLEIGLPGWFGHAVALMARREADCPRVMLLVPGMSTIKRITSSMWMLCRLIGMLTINSIPAPKGMSMLRRTPGSTSG